MNDTTPKISVVTVCRNALDSLRLTARSVLAQTYPQIEYIIVDGASTDGTGQFLQGLDDERAKWVSERDAGIYDAMNKGAAMATGEWVIFMNAGDTFAADDTIERVFGGGDLADAGVVYGNVLKRGADGSLIEKQASAPRNCHRMFFCHQSAFYRRRELEEAPFDPRHRMSADIHQVKRLIAKGMKFKQLDFPVAVFDTTGVSNARRSEGLRDNISVVRELDSPLTQLRLLPKLVVPYLMCRLRGK